MGGTWSTKRGDMVLALSSYSRSWVDNAGDFLAPPTSPSGRRELTAHLVGCRNRMRAMPTILPFSCGREREHRTNLPVGATAGLASSAASSISRSSESRRSAHGNLSNRAAPRSHPIRGLRTPLSVPDAGRGAERGRYLLVARQLLRELIHENPGYPKGSCHQVLGRHDGRGISPTSIRPCRSHPVRASQVRGGRTGAGPGGRGADIRHPSNQAADDRGSTPRAPAMCFRKFCRT
jgi:hypothetical protein